MELVKWVDCPKTERIEGQLLLTLLKFAIIAGYPDRVGGEKTAA
jgi:hypothetical protein